MLASSKVSVAKLRRIVEAAGATLESHNEGRRQEYEAVAPDGHHWEPDLTALLSTAFKGPASWSEETRKDLAERVAAYGRVEKCTEERCGNCNVPEEDPTRVPLDAVMAHFETVWRSRTPSKDVTDVLAINRCTFTDLFAAFPVLAKDPAGSRQWLAPEIHKTLLRLQREFPEERWDGIRNLTQLPAEEI